MDCYGFVWITMSLYGFVNFCMDSWILGLVLCLGFAMRSSNPPLHVFVEVVGLELVGICIDKLGNEDFYGFVGLHVGHLLGCMKFLLELGFEVFKSMNTCWVLGILLTSPLVFMFGL